MEELPVVNDIDEVICSERREKVHTEGLRHRSVMFFVVSREDGRLLVTRRSIDKRFYPGYWSVVLGGHVTYGDTYEETLRKEMKEEIGTVGDHRCIADLVKDIPEETENVRLYEILVDPEDISLQDKEFEEGKFMNLSGIKEKLTKEDFLPETETVLELFMKDQ